MMTPERLRTAVELEERQPKLTIYVSGKITLNPDFEKQFNAAVSTLEAQGYKVVDPRTVCSNIKNGSWEEYMIPNLIALSQCDAIYMIRNWHSSPGARIEHLWAERTKKIIIYE